MALKDQPYLPLYVRDVLTDEKLVECSPHAHGIYMLLLCILHKQDKYGVLCLKQKYKQNTSNCKMFASMLSKQMPFSPEEIEIGISELADEGVIDINDDTLQQKRMVKDGEISLVRSKVGKTGGSSVTKQYGKSGFLYLMSDGELKHKIGISVNPEKRVYRVRSDLHLGKQFILVEHFPVSDMGKAEDMAHKFYGDKMDGEWVVSTFLEVKESFVLLQANVKANTQANSEDESESEHDYEGIITDLNIKAETKYKFTSKKTRQLINSRMAEGFTLKDFITVNSKKVLSWKNDKDMAKFLRPETLYGTKFEGYLNELQAEPQTEAERMKKKHAGVLEWVEGRKQNAGK
jgi:uncharacterized phage protein (TIGR02220 family)